MFSNFGFGGKLENSILCAASAARVRHVAAPASGREGHRPGALRGGVHERALAGERGYGRERESVCDHWFGESTVAWRESQSVITTHGKSTVDGGALAGSHLQGEAAPEHVLAVSEL